MAFKVHIIYSTFRSCFKYLNERKDDVSKSEKEKLMTYAKKFSKKCFFLTVVYHFFAIF